MATVVLCPTFGVGWQGFTAGGLPLNGGLINTYDAGGSTPTATYTTSTGNVQNANPIVLNSDGRPPSEIWLIQGQSYKFVVTDSLANTLGTYDNIPGINDMSVVQGTLPIAHGGTAQTTTQGALDGLFSTPFTTTAASALNLDTVSSDYVSITGNTAIISVSLAPGRERTLLFQSTVAVSSNSTLSLIGSTTVTASAGDTMGLRGEAGGIVRSVWFQRANAMTVYGTQASTFTWDGSGGSTGSITMTYQKIGNFVTLHIPLLSATTGTSSTVLASNTALPAALRPGAAQDCPVSNVVNNGVGVASAGFIQISTGGIVSLRRDNASATFTNSAVAGTTQGITISYYVA